MHCSATLRVFSDGRLSSEVTQRLGIEPTDAVEKGQRTRPAAKHLSSVSAWRLTTQWREGDLSEHLVELLDLIEPVLDQLVSLSRDGYEVDLWCSVESLDTERAIKLEPALLRRLSAVPGPLLIDAWTIFADDE